MRRASPSYERDLRPLFRAKDREEMMWAFDLWNAGDVRAHGELILDRLENGAMPCDDRWPAPDIELFRDWMSSGMKD